MLNKPRCEKAQNLPRKLPLYCDGQFLCAHQYHCPQTRQYENTADYSKCQRLPKAQEAKPKTDPVRFVVNVVPKEPVKEPKPTVITSAWEDRSQEVDPEIITSSSWNETASEAIPSPIYTKNVSPIDYGVKKETEAPTEPEEKPNKKDAVTNKQVRKETKNGGAVRSSRRRKPKKG